MGASVWRVRDELWETVRPLLPEHQPDPRGGRPRVDDRVCFNAIMFVLVTGIAWRHLPQEMGCSPATAHRRLAAWQRAGVWGALAPRALACPERGGANRLVCRGSRRKSYPCSFGGLHTGPSPVDRARAGSKHHLLTDANGVPLAISLTGGHRNDVTQLLPLVDGVGPVRGRRGHPRRRVERVLADRGYDHDKYRRELWARGVKPVIARRGADHGSGLGSERWVVERTFAWLHNLRRLRVRYERSADLHLAFMQLGCAVICQRILTWP